MILTFDTENSFRIYNSKKKQKRDSGDFPGVAAKNEVKKWQISLWKD